MTLETEFNQQADASKSEYITVWIGDQLFGLPILRVQDVFMPSAMTEVPMTNGDVAGVLNLCGRIVTAISMRLGLPPLESDRPVMAVGIEAGNESYGLVIDSVGDVVSLDASSHEDNPANPDPRWAQVSGGVQRLEDQLMVVLDVDRVLALETELQAA